MYNTMQMREIKSGLKSAESCSEKHSRPRTDACVYVKLTWEGEVLCPRHTGGFFKESVSVLTEDLSRIHRRKAITKASCWQ